ncbi:zinc finger protein 699-like [Armigeres subalbatus]|uniref:zinc finger protein 699-like n=1 Tax=Armigeres subalbatus TaxID=124917 RepID=UPI002ED364EF
MVRCALISCGITLHAIKSLPITLHKFPRNPTVRNQWVAFTERTDLVDPDSAYLCSQHFDKHDYENVYMKGQRRLCKTAVPSIRDAKSAKKADKEAIQERSKIIEELLRNHDKLPAVVKKTTPMFIKREAIDIPASPPAESSDQQDEIYISDGDTQSEGFVLPVQCEYVIQPEATTPKPVSPTINRCVVPNCKNFLQEWFAPFPNDLGLIGLWRQCIEVGSGLLLDSMSKLRQNGTVPVVCSMHFLGYNQADPPCYRQPTLYFREDIVVEVDRCCLCSRMHLKENMIEKDATFNKKFTIEQLVTSYFGPTYFDEKATEEYLCEECVAKLDMMYRFQLQTVNARERSGVLRYRMSREKIVFQQNRFDQGLLVTQQSVESIVVDNSAVYDVEVYSLSDSEEEPVINRSVVEPKGTKEKSHDPKLENKEKLQKSRLTCYLCKTCYENTAMLLSHLMMVHVDDEFNCQECNVTFNDSTSFNVHLARHDPDCRPFKCDYCPLRFAHRSGKRKHQSDAHTATQNKKSIIRNQKLVCSACGKVFRDKTAMDRHDLFHHKGQPVTQCDICKGSFASRRNLKRHIMIVHRGDRPYQCKFCRICYKTSQLLLDHVNENHRADLMKNGNHDADVPPPSYSCELCNEAFVSRRLLVRHNRKHSGKKTVYRKVARVEGLVRRNGGGSNYQNVCKLCEAAFPKGAEIIEHFKTSHPEKELEYHPCSVCGNIFFNRKQLLVHCNAHTDKFACSLCEKRHGSTLGLQRHKSIKHGIPLAEEFVRECPHCNKKCLKGMYYSRHLKSHLTN